MTHGIKDYEALALRLAKKPSLREGGRNRLATNQLRIACSTSTASDTRDPVAGEQPRSFAVEPRVSKPERPRC